MSGAIIVFSCWVSITAVILTLKAFHCPLWLATVVGVPLGFVLGFPLSALLSFLLARSVKLLSRGKIILPENEKTNLIEGIIVPTLVIVVMTLVWVSIFAKVKHDADLHRHQAALAQPSQRVQPTR